MPTQEDLDKYRRESLPLRRWVETAAIAMLADVERWLRDNKPYWFKLDDFPGFLEKAYDASCRDDSLYCRRCDLSQAITECR
jgi:hypothetical protein